MIIIDMEKPKDCVLCPCFNGEFVCCNLLDKGVASYASVNGIDKDCPIKDLKTMIDNTVLDLEKEVTAGANTYHYTNVKKVEHYKVKRCPFCGRRPAYEVKIEGRVITSRIYCDNTRCLVKPSTVYSKKYRTVVNVWNTRKERKYNNDND